MKRILKTISPRKIGVLKGSTAVKFEAATLYETLAPLGLHKFAVSVSQNCELIFSANILISDIATTMYLCSKLLH